MSVAFSILSKGFEHNNELKNLLPQIGNRPVYVYTDNEVEFDNNHNVFYDIGDFNFNKKLYPLKEALKDYDVVVCLDTDITILNNRLFENIEDLEEGIYVPWVGKTQTYKNNKTSIYQLFHENGNKELTTYIKSLTKYGATEDNLNFFDEFFFIVVLRSVDLKKKFIDTWEKIYIETIEYQPKDRHKNILKGACESLIISLVCEMCGIKIIANNPDVKYLINSIIHSNIIKQSKNIL